MSLECEINIFAFKDPGVQITTDFLFFKSVEVLFPPPCLFLYLFLTFNLIESWMIPQLFTKELELLTIYYNNDNTIQLLSMNAVP